MKKNYNKGYDVILKSTSESQKCKIYNYIFQQRNFHFDDVSGDAVVTFDKFNATLYIYKNDNKSINFRIRLNNKNEFICVKLENNFPYKIIISNKSILSYASKFFIQLQREKDKTMKQLAEYYCALINSLSGADYE